MTILFIIPLVVVALAVWIYKNSSDEIAYLAAATSVVGLVLSLILAPWQIKLVLLAIALLTSSQIWQPRKPVEIKPNFQLIKAQLEGNLASSKAEKEDHQSSTQLVHSLAAMVYRGVNYKQGQHMVKVNYDPSPRKYRGQVCLSSPIERPILVQSHFELKYRGATVNPHKSVAPELEDHNQEKEKKVLVLIEPK